MLVLTRKSGQAIKIGESVTVTVVQLGRGRVRLGIAAPARCQFIGARSTIAFRSSSLSRRAHRQASTSSSLSKLRLATSHATPDEALSGGRRDSMSSAAMTRLTAVLSGRS